MKYKNEKEFIKYLYSEKGFFNNIGEINEYNINAIVELVQYYNIKEYKDMLFTKEEIKKEIENYYN